ncbi:MAG: hypothetical protein IPN46_10125 [Saprospiraceae bacterium]|nr:hypothetical protein [Saprospiraceae bacterium]
MTRTDDGYYYFIHKSFMEYFVATEFEKGKESPFYSKFDVPLTIEMIEMLDFRKLPEFIVKLVKFNEDLTLIIDKIKEMKNQCVKQQNYEIATDLRILESMCIRTQEELNPFCSMDFITSDKFKEKVGKIVKLIYSSTFLFTNENLINIFKSKLKYFEPEISFDFKE